MTTTRRITAAEKRQAEQAYREGLQCLDTWDLEDALRHFRSAERADPSNPEYPLARARALARGGDYDQALRAVADYLQLDPESETAERLERLFGQALDDVESALTERMQAAGRRLEEIGAAIQMWLEFRVSWGRRPLAARKPASWAAALDYTVRKINGQGASARELAAYYGVSEATLRERHQELVEVLDLMPCDYRYFTGEHNPLDKLVEAAQMLEELEAQFRS